MAAIKLAENNVIALGELNELEAKVLLRRHLLQEDLPKDNKVVHKLHNILTFLPFTII